MNIPQPAIGSVGWIDLTVPEAGCIRDFYSQVTGWKPESLEMGGYADYLMQEPETGKNVAGVCHARGLNAQHPPVWLIYIIVKSLDESLLRCTALGGSVKAPPRSMGSHGKYSVIQDPSGAFCALFEITGNGG